MSAAAHPNGYESMRQVERSQHDALLGGVAEAARRLLSIADFDAAVNGALDAIATSAAIDRICILQHHSATNAAPEFATCPYEWTAPDIPVHRAVPGRFPMVYGEIEGFSQWIQALKAGEPVQKLKKEMSAAGQALQDIDQALSVLTVPIFVEGEYWGNFGFDDCTTERIWNDAEIAVLETAAASFAGALQRRANEAELKDTYQQLLKRDRILEATAAASEVLLTEIDFDTAINTALQILGESIGCDRIGVAQQFDDPDGKSLGFVRFLYEWHSSHTYSQLNAPSGLKDFHWQEMGLADWFETMTQGEAIGQTIDELPDIFRQGQQLLDVQSTHNVPIFVEGRFWGVFGIDHCREKKLLTETELVAFKTAASCVGSAIAQERMRQARQAAERNVLREREAAAQERVTVAEAHNQTLAERDRILETTAAAANVMLVNNDFESAVNQALQIIGEGLNVDRVGLGKYFPATSLEKANYIQFLYEWNTPDTVVQAAHPELSKITSEGIEFAFETVEKGGIFGGVVDELPEPFRSSQIELGVKSTYSIPVHVSGQYWGVLCLDDCHRKTRRSESELEAIKTLTNCIGSAIERDQIRAAREAAERTAIIERERAARADELEAANKVLSVRDRWLETTATAANQLLSATDITTSVKAALATIGENLECDRLAVMRHVKDPNGHPLGAVQSLYEWDAEGIRAQIEDPELQLISATGLEDWFTRFYTGDWVGGHVADLPEPARSSQTALGVLSTYAVPICIDDQLWGLVGMDYCREARKLSAAELAVLQTAASCVGSAIYQAQVRRDRAAQERAKLLGSVAEAANLLLRSADFTEVLPEVTRLLGEAVECDRCGIGQSVIHSASNKPLLNVRAEWEWCRPGILYSKEFSTQGDQLFAWDDAPNITAKLRRGEVVNTLTADLSEPDRSLMMTQGNTAECMVPITVDQQLWGFISFDNCGEPQLYDEAEIAILQIAAESIASAISRQAKNEALRNAERAVLEEREKAARDRAAQLSRSNQALKRSLDLLAQQPELDAFLQGVVNEATAQTGADTGHLFLYDADIRSCWLHVSTDNNGDWRSVPDMSLWLQPVPVDEAPLFWEKMFERKALVLEDMQSNLKPGPHIWEASIAWHLRRGHTSTICTPLLLGEQVLGFFGLAFVGETNITQEDVELAQALTNQATLAIQFTRLAEEAKQAAIFQEQEKAARDRATELAKANEAIAQTLNALTETPELETFLGQIMTTVSETVNACKVHLFLYDEATDTLNQHITVQDGRIYPGAAPDNPEIFRHPIPSDITGAWQVIVESEKPFTMDERYPESAELYWPSTVEWHQEQGHVSTTCACMKVGNKPIGFIGFAFRHLPVLTDEQLEFIQALTNQATLSIHLTRLAKQAQATALTDERNRLAREIHDTLAQAFTGVSLHLEAVRSLTSQPDATLTADNLEKAQIYIRRARDLARRGLSEARRSVRALRCQALETDDLPDALRKTLDQTTRHTNLATAFHLEGDAVPLSDDIQLNLLRIAQEATTNTLRHAKATQLDLTLSFTVEHIRLRIVDNGTGFDTATAIEKGGFGLIGIRERAARFYGTFDLQSRPGVGTMLDVMMPLSELPPRIDPLS